MKENSWTTNKLGADAFNRSAEQDMKLRDKQLEHRLEIRRLQEQQQEKRAKHAELINRRQHHQQIQEQQQPQTLIPTAPKYCSNQQQLIERTQPQPQSCFLVDGSANKSQQQVATRIATATKTNTGDDSVGDDNAKLNSTRTKELLKSLELKRLRLNEERERNLANIVAGNTSGSTNDKIKLQKTKQSQEEQQTSSSSRSNNWSQPLSASKPQNPSKQTSLDDGTNVNLSFCGCGFLGIYHVGVASCFHEYAPQVSMHKIAGSSAGALVAIAYICGNIPLAYCTTDFLAVAIEARAHTLGPFHPSFDVQAMVREALERGLPEDAYKRADGKLHVSLTRVDDGENVVINSFESNEDLIQVLLCSCFIPFWSGIRLPKYKGISYMDGGFSKNLLELDSKTVSVSPFAGEADICPEDDTLNLLQINLSNTSFSISPDNLYRLSHALLPPEPEVLSELCKQGFADGIKYLQRRNLISCTKCLEIRSSLLVTTTGQDLEEVISMSSEFGAGEADSLAAESTTTVHNQLIVEQQEQQLIKIEGSGRRDSIVSSSSQLVLQHSGTTTKTTFLDDAGDEMFCYECEQIKQRLLDSDPLPTRIGERIRDACEKVNKSLYKWIYSHRPVKYLSYLMVPYYLPIDISLSLLYKYWKRMPTLVRSDLIADITCEILEFLIEVLRRMQTRSTSSILLDSTGLDWHPDEVASVGKHRQEAPTQQTPHLPSPATGTVAAAAIASAEASADQHGQVPQQQQQHHHHLHHHHHHHHPTRPRANSFRSTATAASTSTASSTPTSSSQPRELHSLEDTFDSIVDVTSKQEARIFAYYFRDAKNRLQLTEIFDLQRAAELSSAASSLSLASVGCGGANSQQSAQLSGSPAAAPSSASQ